MLFNSLEFFLFLPIVFVLYWFVFNKNLKHQNLLILFSSYIFYGWWDYRFLSLIFLSTIVDYFIGLSIPKQKDNRRKKYLLWMSMLFNLGVLGFFKYFNFFIDSWIDMFSAFGYEMQSTWMLKIILPVGISFYTFQTMSYTIDIYRKDLKPTKDFISFASFVSFFPQLVAGPIERATNLLPQILNIRKFNYEQAIQGLRLILWGLFKKVVIADSLGPIVDNIFGNYQDFGGGTLWLGAIFFAFQIYCDFSGYSDIAIGTSKLFGIELMSNFKFPYFSRNIGEFWRRWHISLSTWFRDYLYIPLGGSKEGKWKSLRNIFVIFIVSGFWHGANWTFIIWGGIHALLYVPSFIVKRNRKFLTTVVAENTWLPSFAELFQMARTFFFVTLAWVFFRSDNLQIALDYLGRMFFGLSGDHPQFKQILGEYTILKYIVPLLALEWIFRRDERNLMSFKMNVFVRRLAYLSISIIILYKLILVEKESFIYFQF